MSLAPKILFRLAADASMSLAKKRLKDKQNTSSQDCPVTKLGLAVRNEDGMPPPQFARLNPRHKCKLSHGFKFLIQGAALSKQCTKTRYNAKTSTYINKMILRLFGGCKPKSKTPKLFTALSLTPRTRQHHQISNLALGLPISALYVSNKQTNASIYTPCQ